MKQSRKFKAKWKIASGKVFEIFDHYPIKYYNVAVIVDYNLSLGSFYLASMIHAYIIVAALLKGQPVLN